MVQYLLWGVITLAMNAVNTALSRARASASFKYHSIMAAIAGFVWIFNQLFAVNILYDIWHTGNWVLFCILVVLYMIATVVGSVGSHWFLMHHFEHGSSRVGARLE